MWGAPDYILEPKLQKGESHIPKWTPRSLRGVFLGFCRLHSTIMGLVFNLHTRSISSRLHDVFDDIFTTVASAHNEEVVTKILTNMITNPNDCLRVSLYKDTNPTLADELLAPEEVQ